MSEAASLFIDTFGALHTVSGKGTPDPPRWYSVLCPRVGWLTSPSLVLVNCQAGTTQFSGSLVYNVCSGLSLSTNPYLFSGKPFA